MRLALSLGLLIAVGCGRKPQPILTPEAAIAKGTAFLWSRQGPDGGWHSEAYGLLKSGQSLTPFILTLLLRQPSDPKAVDRAREFIRRHTNLEGGLGKSDPEMDDYPTYATALAVPAGSESGRSFLRKQQFTEENGWKREDAPYGGWGFGEARRPPEPGHLDLSMTRYALQALGPGDPACAKAEVFLRKCQNKDGGFLFSPVVVDANKAGRDRSYGTATADGILALLAIGAKPDDPRIQAALRWLVEHHRVDRVPGFPDDDRAWSQGMLYYYLAASAEVFARLGGRDWRKEMSDALVTSQRPDGSWRNESFLMKEDDPLIATRFAVAALLSATTSPP